LVAERVATTEVARGLVVVILSPVQAGKAEVPLEQHCPLPGAAILIITTADCGDPTTICFCCLGHPDSMGPATPASIKTATISPLLKTPKPPTLLKKRERKVRIFLAAANYRLSSAAQQQQQQPQQQQQQRHNNTTKQVRARVPHHDNRSNATTKQPNECKKKETTNYKKEQEKAETLALFGYSLSHFQPSNLDRRFQSNSRWRPVDSVTPVLSPMTLWLSLATCPVPIRLVKLGNLNAHLCSDACTPDSRIFGYAYFTTYFCIKCFLSH
jgi:hypothetical protein